MQKEHWSHIINSHSTFSFQSVKDVWYYRDLLWMFVKRDIVTNYKQTILGPLWFIIQPILTTLMYVLIFNRIANIETPVNPILFYLSGVAAWNYFAECLNKTSTTFKDNSYIFGKVYFPRIILPLSVVVSNLLKFAIQFILFIIAIFYFRFAEHNDIFPSIYLLLFPVLIFIMAGLGLGLGMIITSLTTKYRDLTFLVQFGVQLLMYATPVIYPLSKVSGSKLAPFIIANPMTTVMETIRVGFLGIDKGTFNWSYLIYTIISTLLILICGFYVFSKTEKTFTDTV